MKRLLLVHRFSGPAGGGEGVAAWAMEALRDDFEISVLSWGQPDFPTLNRRFGTSLRASDCRILRPPRATEVLLDALPLPLLQLALLQGRCRELCRQRRYDVLLSTYNEFCFPRPGVQYIHWTLGRVKSAEASGLHWSASIPGLLRLYHRSALAVGRSSTDAVRRNLTLVNSSYTGRQYESVYGAPFEVLHPPVPGNFDAAAGSGRSGDFVWVGRIAPQKRLEDAIEILSEVRRRGRAVRLHIAGIWDCGGGYRQRLERMLAEHGEWVDLHHDLERRDLVALLSGAGYGLHTMPGEHFGMVVAEAQRAGCLVFAPDSGGPREILGEEPALLFASPEEAAEKIGRVLEDEALRTRLQDEAAQRRDLFTVESFTSGLRRAVQKSLAPS